MFNKAFSRRSFLQFTSKSVAAAVVSASVIGCIDSSDNNDPTEVENTIQLKFLHGIASGDPTADSVILWTRITPDDTTFSDAVVVSWEVATDEEFTNVLRNGSTDVSPETDYTLKVDAVGLDPNTRYYYRFISNNVTSTVGATKTLPTGNIDSVKLAVMSCSNYPTGFFNVYDLASQQEQLDAVLHLGDYIYEYGADGYGAENAEAMGRQVTPAGELLTLADYRTRYALYRGDESLQRLHATAPFITVWDDHEIANDAYVDGAENHDESEGDFEQRKLAAMQAYFEWLPIRPASLGDNQTINRSFSFGDLVDIHTLDTRVVGRDKQLDYADYTTAQGLNAEQFSADLLNPNRSMLGAEQLGWLQGKLASSTSKWQVLAQQVLMGKMDLPAAIATQQMSIPQFAELAAIAQLAARAAANDPTLTVDQLTFLQANQDRLTPEVVGLLQLPNIPYNLDAWDGYFVERETILGTAKSYNKNLVVLAGDTHNAWANNLTDMNGNFVGVEFATASVTSPGLEQYLNISEPEVPATEAGIKQLINDLQYLNVSDRGFMVVTFSSDEVISTWHFVDTITSTSYQENSERQASLKYVHGTEGLTAAS